MKSALLFPVSLLFVSVVGSLPACGVLFLDGRPCPCATGWICCPSANTCVADETQCDEMNKNDPNIAVAPGSVTLVSSTTVRCLTEDADHVYWMDESNTLFAVPRSGGPTVPSRFAVPAQAPLTGSESRPLACGLAIGGKYIYATLRGLGKIAKVSLETDGAWDLGGHGWIFGALSSPASIVVDDAFVYVAEEDTGIIKKYPRGDAVSVPGDAGADADASAADGGAGSTSGSAALTDVALFEAHGGTSAHSLVADADSLYWFDASGLRKMAKTGGTITTLTTGFGDQLAVSGDVLVWLSPGIGKGAQMLPKAGGSVSTLVWLDGQAVQQYEDSSGWSTQVSPLSDVCSGPGPYVSSATSADPTDWQATDPAALAADAHQVYFASWNAINAGAPATGQASRVFTYRDRCADTDDPEEAGPSVAAHLLVDDRAVVWASPTSISTHPR